MKLLSPLVLLVATQLTLSRESPSSKIVDVLGPPNVRTSRAKKNEAQKVQELVRNPHRPVAQSGIGERLGIKLDPITSQFLETLEGGEWIVRAENNPFSASKDHVSFYTWDLELCNNAAWELRFFAIDRWGKQDEVYRNDFVLAKYEEGEVLLQSTSHDAWLLVRESPWSRATKAEYAVGDRYHLLWLSNPYVVNLSFWSYQLGSRIIQTHALRSDRVVTPSEGQWHITDRLALDVRKHDSQAHNTASYEIALRHNDVVIANGSLQWMLDNMWVYDTGFEHGMLTRGYIFFVGDRVAYIQDISAESSHNAPVRAVLKR